MVYHQCKPASVVGFVATYTPTDISLIPASVTPEDEATNIAVPDGLLAAAPSQKPQPQVSLLKFE